MKKPAKIFLCARNQQKIEACLQDFEDFAKTEGVLGVNFAILVADCSRSADCFRVVDEVVALGEPLHCFMNNAGFLCLFDCFLKGLNCDNVCCC